MPGRLSLTGPRCIPLSPLTTTARALALRRGLLLHPTPRTRPPPGLPEQTMRELDGRFDVLDYAEETREDPVRDVLAFLQEHGVRPNPAQQPRRPEARG